VWTFCEQLKGHLTLTLEEFQVSTMAAVFPDMFISAAKYGCRTDFEARERSEVQQEFNISAVSEAGCGTIKVRGSCRSPIIL
jgi:hypothetical protein